MDNELKLVVPFENFDFFNMVISDDRTNNKKFQQRIKYVLNVENFDINDELIKLIINNITLFRNNLLENYDKLKNSEFSNIIDVVIERWNLNDLPFEKAKKIYLRNRDYFDKYFNYYHSGWLYLNSKKTNPSNAEIIDSHNVSQRLYISINSDCIDSFSKELQTLFEKNKLPYNFKIQCGAKLRSADCICIYSDSFDRTKDYLKIMMPLIEKYKNSIHKPQPHLGIINDQIGLGFQLKDGYSYSEIMEQISYKALKKACNDIYQSHQISQVEVDKFDEEYKNGVVSYIVQIARMNISIYQLLQQEFEKSFRLIIKNEYPDFDIDMCQIVRELESENMENKY